MDDVQYDALGACSYPVEREKTQSAQTCPQMQNLGQHSRFAKIAERARWEEVGRAPKSELPRAKWQSLGWILRYPN